jgi:hypothetical protein
MTSSSSRPFSLTCAGALTLFALGLPLGHAHAATHINTLPPAGTVGSFGESLPSEIQRNTAIGQTITVPLDDNVLTNFRFTVDDLLTLDDPVVHPVHFDAFVSPWDGEKASGPPVFTAGPFTTTNDSGEDGYGELFSIDTGELELTPGAQYVLFFSASARFDGIIDGASLASAFDVYPGGEIFSATTGNNLAALQTDRWARFEGHPFDLAFTATFVPEPSSFVLAGITAIGLLAARRQTIKTRRQSLPSA